MNMFSVSNIGGAVEDRAVPLRYSLLSNYCQTIDSHRSVSFQAVVFISHVPIYTHPWTYSPINIHDVVSSMMLFSCLYMHSSKWLTHSRLF